MFSSRPELSIAKDSISTVKKISIKIYNFIQLIFIPDGYFGHCIPFNSVKCLIVSVKLILFWDNDILTGKIRSLASLKG